jgi:hypothetical protein
MDIHRIFKPVIYISRVFCLTPFSTVEDSGSTKYKFSVFWLLYSTLGVCASIVFQILIFWFTLRGNDAAMYIAISNVVSAASCVWTFVTQVLCLINGKNIIRILDHLSLLDSEHTGARISYCRLYKVFILLLTYSIICLVAPAIMWFAALDTNSVHIFKILYHTTVYFMWNVVLLLSDTQFIHFALLLKYRFSVLNHTLINLTVPSLYKSL